MKDLKLYITEGMKESAEDYLENILRDCPEDPQIYDEKFDIDDHFDWWQYDDGSWDESYEVIKSELNGKFVAGWSSEENFGDVESILPHKVITLIQRSKPTEIYNKSHNKVEKWSGKNGKTEYTVLRFKQFKSKSGSYGVDYWYTISVE